LSPSHQSASRTHLINHLVSAARLSHLRILVGLRRGVSSARFIRLILLITAASSSKRSSLSPASRVSQTRIRKGRRTLNGSVFIESDQKWRRGSSGQRASPPKSILPPCNKDTRP
jgi:hypothetical protein